jgi:hypothetical protein
MFDQSKRWTVGVDYADQKGRLKHSEIFSVDSIAEVVDAYPGELIMDVRASRNARTEPTWAERWCNDNR